MQLCPPIKQPVSNFEGSNPIVTLSNATEPSPLTQVAYKIKCVYRWNSVKTCDTITFKHILMTLKGPTQQVLLMFWLPRNLGHPRNDMGSVCTGRPLHWQNTWSGHFSQSLRDQRRILIHEIDIYLIILNTINYTSSALIPTVAKIL